MKKIVQRWIVFILCIALAAGSAVPVAAQEETLCQNLDAAVVQLRTALMAHESNIIIRLNWKTDDSTVCNLVLNQALEHTGHPKQGDYLYRSIRSCPAKTASQQQEGGYLLTLTYTPVYYTTAAQEQELDAAVEALLQQLDLWEASDYDKIWAIYDYICQNVVPYNIYNFDYMNGYRLPHSAYSALVLKTAVCQGYAALFYRLCLELGVDNRLIAGTSHNRSHGWNIVRLGDLYYNIDTTWDAENFLAGKPYEHFLVGSADFPDHTPKATYTSEAFMAAYPISEETYTPAEAWVKGDLDGDGAVNEQDAVYLLQYVLLPEFFPVAQPVDYTGDDLVNEDDAIYLLQHVLLPADFPI